MIELKKFDSDNYDLLISWINNEETLMQFAGPAFTFPLDHHQLNNSLKDPARFAFIVIEKSTRNAIGYAEIYKKENIACLCRIIIGNENFRGKGMGKQIVDQLLNYTFIDLNQSHAELNVFDWNLPAIKCYQNAGFVTNPNKKSEIKINDKIWISLNMILDKETWLQLKQ